MSVQSDLWTIWQMKELEEQKEVVVSWLFSITTTGKVYLKDE